MGRRLRLFEAFDETEFAKLADDVGAAGAQGILEPEFDGIDAKLVCKLVHDAFGGEGRLRCARPAIGADLWLVDDRRKPLDADVGYVIGRKDAAHAAAQRRSRERARLVCEERLHCRDRAVALGTDLDGRLAGGAGARTTKHVFARHAHLDRTSGELGQHQRHGFEIHGGLAAKASADLRRYHLQLVDVHVHLVRQVVANVEMALRGGPDGRLGAFVIGRKACRWFDVALVNRRRRERAFDDHVRFRETGFHVADLVDFPLVDVRELPVFFKFFVQQHVALQGIVEVHHRRQRFVVDFNKLNRCQGNGPGRCRYGRNGVSVVEHLFMGKVVAGDSALSAKRQPGEVGRRHHCEYTVQGHRLRRVD